MRYRIIPHLYWGEPLMMPAIWPSLVLVLLFLEPRAAGSWLSVATFGAFLSLAILGACDALLVRELSGRALDLKWAFLGPIRDFAAFGTWVAGACRRTVVWRGNAFTIGAGSTLTPCNPSAVNGELHRPNGDAEVISLEV